MDTIESSASLQTTSSNTGWFRRGLMGAAFAVAAVTTLGGVSKPAEAYWYYYGYNPYYAYYPHYYGWYGYRPYYPAYYGGWGWHRGWRHW